MKIADEIMRGPSRGLYRDADWNKICLDKMGRPDPRAAIRKLLSVRQLVGPLAGQVTWLVDVRAQ